MDYDPQFLLLVMKFELTDIIYFSQFMRKSQYFCCVQIATSPEHLTNMDFEDPCIVSIVMHAKWDQIGF